MGTIAGARRLIRSANSEADRASEAARHKRKGVISAEAAHRARRETGERAADLMGGEDLGDIPACLGRRRGAGESTLNRSSRRATRFSAPRMSPAASARPAAVISESTGIPSHLSLPRFDARR